MATWSKDELRKIAETDDLHISPFREDGVTYGTPTWIWSVALDDALYVRAYYGQNSRWYQAAVRQKAGRISAAGLRKEVSFEPVDGPINDLIDDAYRAKYRGSPYLDSMISARARSATVKVMPRGRKYHETCSLGTRARREALAWCRCAEGCGSRGHVSARRATLASVLITRARPMIRALRWAVMRPTSCALSRLR